MTFRVLNLSSIPQIKKKKKHHPVMQVKNGKNMTKQRINKINFKNLDQYQAA